MEKTTLDQSKDTTAHVPALKKRQPLPLRQLCRHVILRSIGLHNSDAVNKLPLPQFIKSFLNTYSIPQDFSTEQEHITYNMRFAYHPHHKTHQVHPAKCLIDGSDVLTKTHQPDKLCQSCTSMGLHMMTIQKTQQWVHLQHPNLMNCHGEIHNSYDLVCHVMDFPLINLKEYIRRLRMLQIFVPEFLMWQSMNSLASVFSYLENEGIYPELDDPKHVVIDCQGILKLENLLLYLPTVGQSKTRAYVICSHPIYAAPETWKYCEYSIKSTVWSIGVMLFELATRVTPMRWENESSNSVYTTEWFSIPLQTSCNALLKETQPSNDLPYSKELESALMSCLSSLPNRRPKLQDLVTLSASMMAKTKPLYNGPMNLLELMPSIKTDDSFEAIS